MKSVFTFKWGQALRVATFLLQCYNSSSCNGGRKLLLVFWLILRGHTGYSECVGTPSNSVSLLCLCVWLVTVHLKGCLERHCFHKDLAGFPIQLSTILKGSWSQLFPLTSIRKSKRSCFPKKSSSEVFSHDTYICNWQFPALSVRTASENPRGHRASSS